MLEQEIASVIKWLLDATGNPHPYYWNVPQSFAVPAAYFPPPEIDTGGETLASYNMDYVMFVKFFSNTTQEAYALGLAAVTNTRAAHNLVPLIGEDGERAGRGIRINDPALKTLDDGAAQLTLSWRSRRPYNGEDAQKVMTIDLSMYGKQYTQTAIDEETETAVKNYILS